MFVDEGFKDGELVEIDFDKLLKELDAICLADERKHIESEALSGTSSDTVRAYSDVVGML